MNYYRFPDRKVYKAGIFLFLLLMQLLARSTMYTSTFIGFVPAQLSMYAVMGAGGLIFLFHNRRQLKDILTDRRMLAVAVLTAVVLVPMVVKVDFRPLYFSILLCMYFAVFLSYFLTLKEAAGYYVRIMFLLSAWSLIGLFVLKPLVNAGFLPGHPFDSPGGWHMYNFGLTFVVNKNIEMVNALRAFGIFREPGLYQIFLCIAIQLNNYTVDWKKQWQMWAVNAVLMLALLTTFATGGVIAMALYIVFLFFDKGLYKDRRLRALALVLVIVVAGALAFAIAQNGAWAMELVWMVLKVFQKTDSYTDRVGSILTDAQIFLQHPIVGENLEDVLHSVPNNTASSPILFAAFGIFMGLLHVLSWAALAWKKERHVVMNLILMVILFVPFNTQNVIHDMFFWLFPIMALMEKGLPLLEKRTKKV